MPSDSLDIFNITGSLPKLVDWRLPLLKVLKTLIYSSNTIIDYVQPLGVEQSRDGEASATITPPSETIINKPKGKVGSRETGYTKQSNALKQLGMRNNIYGHASQNIIQSSLNDHDIMRIKRNIKKSVDPYQSEIEKADEVQKKKARAAVTRKRKQNTNDKKQTKTLFAVNTKQEDSEEAKEILMLKMQLNDLKKNLQSSSNSPVVQAEVVVADDDNNNKPLKKRNNTNKNNKRSSSGAEYQENSSTVNLSTSENVKEEVLYIIIINIIFSFNFNL
jgi:hypothetical protein